VPNPWGNKTGTKHCGIKGQIMNMLEAGVDPNYQLQPAIDIQTCKACADMGICDSGITDTGWTKSALREFLSYLDSVGIRILTLWFGDALLSPKTDSTCAWVMPMLHDWVTNQSTTL
jgi:hypothetical protein